MSKLNKKPLFNPYGTIDIVSRKVINGDTTNLNDFNNLKYSWTSSWYRQAMNNFWIPEEVNLTTDIKDYRILPEKEKIAYNKILSFLIFLDSIQTANLPNISEYITSNEINLCLCIQTFQEAIHSQSYSYILDTICEPQERTEILYQWRNDEYLLKRNNFIGDLYNYFQKDKSKFNLMKVIIANYILEGIYFYSGFMFFYNLARNNKMPGSVQIIRYINRDENTHLWLFRNIIIDLKKENPELFTEEYIKIYCEMIKEGCNQEMKWCDYVLGDNIQGLNKDIVKDYIKYLGNLRCKSLGFYEIYKGYDKEIEDIKWISQFSNANLIKTDFFEARNTAYSKSSSLIDDL